MADLQLRIEAHALANALKYAGKANPGNVLPKIIGEFPDVKSDIPGVRKQIDEVVTKVNAMGLDAQKARLEEIAPDLAERKERKERTENLRELDDVDPKKGVVMRFAPSPSGPMHIGHAITGGLTSLYVKKYGGKFILRIEDTNSDNIAPEAYEMLPKDAEWIFGNVTDVWIQSDRMPIYYSYVERFLDLDAVYVCTCTQEEFKHHVESMADCPCRNLPQAEQKARWKKMFDKEHGYKEGEAVLRFKAGMQHPNPAMRDFPLVRINDSEHPRQGLKYRVWPLMNLCVLVDDAEAGMTHIVRAKDHYDNALRQEMMYKVLGKQPPKAYFVGRYNFEGLEISCSKTRAKIKEGIFTGWDDIRVPFLIALRRRGYRPEVFLKYTGLTGLSLTDKTVSAEEFYKTINAFNKELLDPIASRMSFVADPKEIILNGAEMKEIELDLHPDRKGGRPVKIADKVYVGNDDLISIIGKKVRLMGLATIADDGKDNWQLVTYEAVKKGHDVIVNWVSAEAGEYVPVQVMMPDASLKIGLAEKNIARLAVGDIVQFERFGFCRLDAVEDGVYKFWYTHK